MGMYKLSTHRSALALNLLEDSGPSADTYFDTERRACPQPAAFLSQRTHIMSSTYVYTSFVNDLVLAKSVAVGKTQRQTLLFDRLLNWLLIAWACYHYRTLPLKPPSQISAHPPILAKKSCVGLD